ncbi:MAG: DUF1565 domain-containing protein [Candidatus Helarchaeota archaeon]
MRIEGVQYKPDKTGEAIKKTQPRTPLGKEKTADRETKREYERKLKNVRQSLTGLVSLSKEFRNPKVLTQEKDPKRIKKSFKQIATKFTRDFDDLRKKYSSTLPTRPRSELRIEQKRPRMEIAVYYVSASAPEGGNGSQDQPFRTITQALERAAQAGQKQIFVYIADGVYNENLEITRYTQLIGDSVVLKGSINSDQHLTLKGIHIREPMTYGIRQTGGTLILENSSVIGTSNVEGAAIQLSNGAEALLTNFILIQNQGRALLLTGEGTKAEVRHAGIVQNTFQPQLIAQIASNDARIGVVEVADGAKLLMEHFVLVDNDFIGILAQNHGMAHLRFCLITGTNDFEELNIIGINIHSFQNATIEMHHFITEKTDAGLYVRNAYLTAMDGIVRENRLGFYYEELPDDYDWETCVKDQCSFQDNEMPTYSIEFEVPTAPLPIPGEPIPEPVEPDDSSCPRVKWDDDIASP